MSIKLVYMWHKKFQDGFTNLKDRSRPGQPKPVVSNANIAAAMSRPDNNWLEIIMGLAHRGVFFNAHYETYPYFIHFNQLMCSNLTSYWYVKA